MFAVQNTLAYIRAFSVSADTLFSLSFPSCAKLNKVAQSKGNATHDEVCLDQLPTYLTPGTFSTRFSNETNNSDLLRLEANLVTISSALLSAATTENPSSTPKQNAPAGTLPTSDKGETTTGGNEDLLFLAYFTCTYLQ